MVLTRVRIGHTRLTYSYLLEREDQPLCISCNEPFTISCNEPFTVKHFLIDCLEFSQVRRQFFQTEDLRNLFEDVPPDNTLTFLKHINLLTKYNTSNFQISTILTLYAYMTHYYSRFITKPS